MRKIGLALEIMKIGHDYITLAEAIGCSRVSISAWCRGITQMNTKYAKKLQDLGIPIEAILNPTTYTEDKK